MFINLVMIKAAGHSFTQC